MFLLEYQKKSRKSIGKQIPRCFRAFRLVRADQFAAVRNKLKSLQWSFTHNEGIFAIALEGGEQVVRFSVKFIDIDHVQGRVFWSWHDSSAQCCCCFPINAVVVAVPVNAVVILRFFLAIHKIVCMNWRHRRAVHTIFVENFYFLPLSVGISSTNHRHIRTWFLYATFQTLGKQSADGARRT